jgi:hypothetical protein
MTTIEHLRHEFDAEEGSFLLQLRCDLRWDREAFGRLVGSMQSYLQHRSDLERIPRWIAAGFWFLSWHVKDWSSHPDFPRPFAAEYYESAYERLHDLAYWCFFGESPYEGGDMEAFAV